MNQVATTDDQDTAITQSSKLTADVVVLRRRQSFVHAELHHGDVGVGIDMAQDRPTAVIEPPFRIHSGIQWLQQLSYVVSQLNIAGGGIRVLVQRAREA